MYYLIKFNDVIKSSFFYSKLTYEKGQESTSAYLCKPVHGIINYSTFICPFESGKCGKEGKKLQTNEYLENLKSFLDEINIFHSF